MGGRADGKQSGGEGVKWEYRVQEYCKVHEVILGKDKAEELSKTLIMKRNTVRYSVNPPLNP